MCKNNLLLKKNLTVTAHSGCESTPDNSIESIVKAFECNADIVELDIRYDKNGIPVLSHDQPTGNEVTLEEAFMKISAYDNLCVNLDIKTTEFLESIPPLAEKYMLSDRIFYTGIFEKDIDVVKTKTPDIKYYINIGIVPADEQTDGYLQSLADKIKDLGAIGLNTHYENTTEKLIEVLHKNCLLVSLWTVNDEKDMINVLSIKPDNITTRFPTILKKLIL